MNILETMIKVGAIWTGASAMAQAAAATQKVEKSSLLASLSLRKMAGTLAAFGLGWKGVEKFSEFLKEGVSNARELQRAQESLNFVLEHNKKAQQAAAKAGHDSMKQTEERLHALAEEMGKTGLSAKVLETTMAGALKAGFDPKTINASSDAFQGMITKMYGIKASTSDAKEGMDKLQLAIQSGMGRAFVTAHILTADEAKHLRKMGSEAERAAFMLQHLSKYQGLTNNLFQTTAGQVERAHRNWELLGETLGGPLARSQDQFTIALGKVAVALQPIAEKFAPKLADALNNLTNVLNNSGPQIQRFGELLLKGFDWVMAHWEEVSRGFIAIASSIIILKTAFAALNIIHKVITGFTSLQTVLTSLPAMWALVSNPIVWVTALIIALAAAIYFLIQHWDQVKAAAVGAWQTIQKTWSQAVSWFQGIFQQIAASTKDIWGPLVEPFQHLWTSIQPIMQNIIKMFATAGDSSAKGFNPIRYILQGLIYDFNVLTQWLRNVWTVCTTMVAPALMQGLQNWGKAIGWVNANVIGPIIDAVAGIIDHLTVGDLWGAFKVWVDTVNKIRDNIINGILDLFKGLAPQIASALAAVEGAIYGVFKSAYDKVIGLFSGIGGAISGAVQSGLSTVTSWIPGMQKKQMGGMVSSPSITALAEKGIPEMVIPIEGTSRSRGLLSSAASMIGMQGGAGRSVVGGSTNLNVSMPITINGAQAGQEGALAREVQRAMQDPIRNLLDQLKKAKAEEARLSYA